ncbi:GTP-binding protein [Lentinula raphanica]|nr:GTP-binding protein [Lentinula raphanica]
MPRIRKKTSKRSTTNDRRKISQKVRESKKKKTKASKKSVEWKSKHKKDPGIPNTFPYKEQILAEVAEQRKLFAEEKQRRKDEKRMQKLATEDAPVDLEDADGIASISAKQLTVKTTSRPVHEVEDSESEDEDAPVLINRDLPHLQAALDQADVVIEVLDARDPLPFRSSYLEELISSKPKRKTLFVLNKIDCAPQEAAIAWTNVLRKQQPTFPFRSATSFLPESNATKVDSKGKGRAKDTVNDALGATAILECLGKLAEEKNNDTPLTVAVVGVTNTGKSSLVNSLARNSAFEIYSTASPHPGPSTTTMPQEMTLQFEGKALRFIDTPGFLWKTDSSSLETEDVRSRDILMRNKGRIDRLKDPLAPVAHLVSRANTEDLMLLYALPAFPKGDVDAFISGVARSQQLVRKKGVLHLTGASKLVLRDWGIGKIRWYSTPPAGLTADKSSNEVWLEGFYAKADEVFKSLRSRKEMRKDGGLIRISPGQVESREVMTEVLYAEFGGNEDEDEDRSENDDEEAEQDEMESEEEEDEDEDEVEDRGESYEEGDDDEVPPPTQPSQKRKRVETQKSLPPKKKVSFGSKSFTMSKSSSTTVPSTKKHLEPKSKKVKSVANAPSQSRQPKTAAYKGDAEAYDFGKYF